MLRVEIRSFFLLFLWHSVVPIYFSAEKVLGNGVNVLPRFIGFDLRPALLTEES